MEKIINISKNKIGQTSLVFKRYLIDKVDISQKLIGIKGARGVGKTTLLLQLLKMSPSDKVLYVSLDNLYFSTHTLLGLAEQFVLKGGKYLYVDEVHKYANWSQEIKNIYDSFPELNVIFTSSSALEIEKGKYDLSRRALIYELPGLSFREFLELKYKKKFDKIDFEDVLFYSDKKISKILEVIKPFQYFEEYLSKGYYPYFIEDENNYHQRLEETIKIVIETDLPAIYKIGYSSVVKLKKLVVLIGGIVPYIPNISKLSAQVGATRDSLLKYLYLLHNAHILRWLSSDAHGINYLNKPEKLYLENTNIAYSIGINNQNIGTLRETFFLNQLSVNHTVTYPKTSDFMVDNKYTFEIGGKNKSGKQVEGIKNAFVVKDNIEYGFDNVIPLWLFGFLY